MQIIKKTPCNKAFTSDINALNIVSSMLSIATYLDQQDSEQPGLLPKDFSYPDGYKEMLDSTIEDLTKRMKATLYEHMSPLCARKVRSFTHNTMPIILEVIAKDNISLEVLGMYIMYHKFVGREVVYEPFYEYTDKEQYAIVVDTLDTAGFKLFDKIKMHNIAKRIVVDYLL